MQSIVPASYVEELVRKTGLPREVVEAKVFAAYWRLCEESED